MPKFNVPPATFMTECLWTDLSKMWNFKTKNYLFLSQRHQHLSRKMYFQHPLLQAEEANVIVYSYITMNLLWKDVLNSSFSHRTCLCNYGNLFFPSTLLSLGTGMQVVCKTEQTGVHSTKANLFTVDFPTL
jgi:hypothetical protein